MLFLLPADQLAYFWSAAPNVRWVLLLLGKAFIGCTLCCCPACLLQQMEGGRMMEVKVVPELQPLPGTVGNWIFLHAGLCSFVWDAAGDVGSSSFIGMGRRAKTRAFCAGVIPALCLNYRWLNILFKLWLALWFSYVQTFSASLWLFSKLRLIVINAWYTGALKK